METLLAKLRAAVADAEKAAVAVPDGSVPLAPSPRGALGVADGEDAPAAACSALDGQAHASAATLPSRLPFATVPRSEDYARLARGFALGGHTGVASLTESILVGSARVLRSGSLLHALRVGQIVCCGVEPPPDGAHGGIPCMRLPRPPTDVVKERKEVSRLVERTTNAARTTLLVSDEAAARCGPLAAALLEALEGLSPFDAVLRVSQICICQPGAGALGY